MISQKIVDMVWLISKELEDSLKDFLEFTIEFHIHSSGENDVRAIMGETYALYWTITPNEIIIKSPNLFPKKYIVFSKTSEVLVNEEVLRLLRNGRIKDAIKLAKKMEDDIRKAETITKSALFLISNEKCKDAEKLVKTVKDKIIRSAILMTVSMILAENCNFKNALKFTEKIETDPPFSETLLYITMQLLKNDMISDALNIAEKQMIGTVSSYVRRKTRWIIAKALAKNGKIEESLRYAKQLFHDYKDLVMFGDTYFELMTLLRETLETSDLKKVKEIAEHIGFSEANEILNNWEEHKTFWIEKSISK